MRERFAVHHDREDYELLLTLERLEGSGDTAGLFELFQALAFPSSTSKYAASERPSTVSYEGPYGIPTTLTDRAQEAWHRAHIARGEQDQTTQEAPLPTEDTFSHTFRTILTTSTPDTFDQSMTTLAEWGKNLHDTAAEPLLRRQITHVLANDTFYEMKMLERAVPRSDIS